jgi:hypothetical protein
VSTDSTFYLLIFQKVEDQYELKQNENAESEKREANSLLINFNGSLTQTFLVFTSSWVAVEGSFHSP